MHKSVLDMAEKVMIALACKFPATNAYYQSKRSANCAAVSL